MIAEILCEVWKLVARSGVYLQIWKEGLLKPIYRKGDARVPQKHRPIVILSCARKVIAEAIAVKVSRSSKVQGRQFGFQSGLSPATTLLDMDKVVKGGWKKIATLELAKAYARVNRSWLIKDCETKLSEEVEKCYQNVSRHWKYRPTGM